MAYLFVVLSGVDIMKYRDIELVSGLFHEKKMLQGGSEIIPLESNN